MTNKKHKLGVIIPYRNRDRQLIDLKRMLRRSLKRQGINFELIIVEQDNAKSFNRGRLLNVGFIYAKKLKCDYVVFHDVDMIPVDVDYSYSDIPLHLATNFVPKSISRHVFDEYFGGVTMFPVEVFENINGYSNEYWGWGYEDDDLLHRCKIKRVELDVKTRKTSGGNTAALKFNGSSYVEAKNVVKLDKPTTFFVSFYPDKIECDHTKYDDTYCVLSIPRFGLSISYNSYQRYNFVMYNTKKEAIYINSEIKPNYKTTICVTLDPTTKNVTMYQDGEYMGEETYSEEIFNEITNGFMYIGSMSPDSDHFQGLINTVAIFDKLLLEREILELSNNQFFGLMYNFGKYKSSDSLITYYDPKFIKNGELVDLVDNENNGKIVGCKTVGFTFDDVIRYRVPFRRESTFRLLPHDENGFVDGAWKDMTTRYNQVRFFNEVSRGKYDTQKDGLSNCGYYITSHTNVDNITHIIVDI